MSLEGDVYNHLIRRSKNADEMIVALLTVAVTIAKGTGKEDIADALWIAMLERRK